MAESSEQEVWQTRQMWIVALAATAIIFDGLDNQVLGFAMPTLIAEWGVTKAEMSPVSAAGLIGMVFGAIWAGALGDKYGRRRLLLISLVLFGAMTMLAALANGVIALGLARFAAGLGLGGALPNATAYAAAFAPVRRRPIAITLTIVCVPIGGLLAGFLARLLLPGFGWQALLAVAGALPIMVAALLLRFLPESIPDAALGSSGKLVDLVKPGLRHDTVTLWAAMFCCLFAVYTVNSWAPTMLKEAGFAATTATDGLSAFNLGGIAGGVCSAWLVTMAGSRRPLLLISAMASVSALAAGLWAIGAIGAAGIVATFVILGFGVHGVQTALFAVAAHVYPNAIKATGVGAAVGIGRIGAVLSAFGGAAALGAGGALAFFGLVALAMTGVFGALYVLKRHIPPSDAALVSDQLGPVG
jgi:AAHS family 4-hydroxybenzoate transporter-like MFS transporter